MLYPDFLTLFPLLQQLQARAFPPPPSFPLKSVLAFDVDEDISQPPLRGSEEPKLLPLMPQ